MSAHDQWTDQLSDYLDGELSDAERTAVEAHLSGCLECSKTLASLRRLVAEASSLTPMPPQNDLWPGVAARITQPRRVSFTLPQLAAASLLLAALSGGAVVLLVGGSKSGTQTAATQSGTADRPAVDTTAPAA